MSDYQAFLEQKQHTGADHGFEPVFMPPQLFDFQQALVQWAVRMGRVLPFRDCKDPEDEKHVHPLQLDVIDRAIALRSNPGETVLTPFMGVGSEVYGAVQAGRRGIGIELKPSYYRQAVRNLEMAGSVEVNADQTELDL
jgi:DNA modification methylase